MTILPIVTWDVSILYIYIAEQNRNAWKKSRLSNRVFSVLRERMTDRKHNAAPAGIISDSTGHMNQGCRSWKKNKTIPPQSNHQLAVFLSISICITCSMQLFFDKCLLLFFQ